MRKTSKKQTKFVIVWGGNLILRGGNFPKGPEKSTVHVSSHLCDEISAAFPHHICKLMVGSPRNETETIKSVAASPESGQ